MQTTGAGDTPGWRFEHKNYGGWLKHSAFTIRSEKITSLVSPNDPDTTFLLAHSLGKASERNPGASTTWEGAMVGATKDYSHVIQSNARIEFAVDKPGAVSVTFDFMHNFSTYERTAISRTAWPSAPLENGVFTAAASSTETASSVRSGRQK